MIVNYNTDVSQYWEWSGRGLPAVRRHQRGLQARRELPDLRHDALKDGIRRSRARSVARDDPPGTFFTSKGFSMPMHPSPASSALRSPSSVRTYLAQAQPQQPPPAADVVLRHAASDSGSGANLGGLAGADKHCQTLAAAAGGGSKTWHAYLSVSAANGQPAVNARDRIGTGPWYNAKNARIAQGLADLHGDTLEAGAARQQPDQGHRAHRKGRAGQRRRRHAEPARHPDRLDARRPRVHRRQPTTPAATGRATRRPAAAQLGHSDRQGGGATSWNSIHPSRGCSQENLVATGGAGLLYCFATN